MKRCAFLSLENTADFVIDDELAIPALRARGWEVDTVSWTADVDWSVYDVVVIRSTWDYQHDAPRFLRVLEGIVAAGTRLENALSTVKWNARKTYLRALEERGTAIVPTDWHDSLDAAALAAAFDMVAANELVVKPQVGANAGDTLRVRQDDPRTRAAAIELFSERPCMVQPFLRSIVEEGEYSLILFDGKLSHAILKTPRRGDFRVQEEHGGIITSVTAPAHLVAQAERAVRAMTPLPLYARADFARLPDGTFGVMELELIEPSLYFRKDPASAERFAAALDARIQLAGAA